MPMAAISLSKGCPELAGRVPDGKLTRYNQYLVIRAYEDDDREHIIFQATHRSATEETRVCDRGVTSDPDIMAGVPVVQDTRVPVHFILDCLAGGMTIPEILEYVPSLTRRQVVAALKWASDQLDRPIRP